MLGAGVNFYNAGDIILGGDGSDVIQGNAGDDIIDGDKWLNVRIGIMTAFDADGSDQHHRDRRHPEYQEHDQHGHAASRCERRRHRDRYRRDHRHQDAGGLDVRGQDQSRPAADHPRDHHGRCDGVGRHRHGASSRATAPDTPSRATADGQVIVTHAIRASTSTAADRLRNIERVQFATGGPLNIIVGTPGNDNPLNGTAQDDLILGLAGADTLNGLPATTSSSAAPTARHRRRRP